MFRALLPGAKRVAYRILGDITDAKNSAVEALVRASVRWRRLSALAPGQLEAWVLRVTANVAYRRGRSRRVYWTRELSCGEVDSSSDCQPSALSERLRRSPAHCWKTFESNTEGYRCVVACLP